MLLTDIDLKDTIFTVSDVDDFLNTCKRLENFHFKLVDDVGDADNDAKRQQNNLLKRIGSEWRWSTEDVGSGMRILLER